MGQASLDLLAIADRPLNCYTFGAMGQCSSIGVPIEEHWPIAPKV